MGGLKLLTMGASLALSLMAAAQAQTPNALPVTPQRLALAQQVVDASGSERTSATMMNAISAQMSSAIGASGTAEDRRFVADLVRDEFKTMLSQVMSKRAEIYAETFSDQELSDLLAFYNSPSGRSYVAKLPEVLQRANAVVLPLIPGMQRDMFNKIIVHVCEEKPCTPDMRAKLNTAMNQALSRQSQPGAH